MDTLVLVIHILAAVGIVGLVLLQHGKGADVGAAFGGGAAGSVFGSTGSANFLSRATAVLAVVFFLTSMGLTYFSMQRTGSKGVMASPPAPGREVPTTQVPTTQAPAAPAPDPASKAQDVPK